MVSPGSGAQDCIGIIANPVSARDVRRIVANASSLQITERVNIVLRLLQGARAAASSAPC
jgi:predicted polyphosphate/ATP-dependent NAD kinase